MAQNEYEDLDAILTVSSSINHFDEWILDSGCYHMSLYRDQFFSLKEFDGGVVLMGNDNAYKTRGIGNIRLKMFDETIRVLTDVRYVPNLKKNLISLGTLNSKGYKLTME